MNLLGVRPMIAQLCEELHRGCESGLYVLWQDGFLRMMAETSRAAKEKHGRRNSRRENHCVVAGSAGHAAGGKACLRGGFTEQGCQMEIEWNRGLLQLPVAGNVDATSFCGFIGSFQDGENGGLANFVISVTDVE